MITLTYTAKDGRLFTKRFDLMRLNLRSPNGRPYSKYIIENAKLEKNFCIYTNTQIKVLIVDLNKSVSIINGELIISKSSSTASACATLTQDQISRISSNLDVSYERIM